jgi:nitrilase
MVPTDKFVIAAVQATPVFMDLHATIEKACDLIVEAGKNGANLVVFPEAFVPGYPDWVWVVPGYEGSLLGELYAELVDNAVSLQDNALSLLCKAAKKAKLHVAIGVNEVNQVESNSSLYNSLIYIDSNGELLGVHRKLVPTSGERTVWAAGDGSTMEVYDTPFGRLGGLICWENYMPLARYTMYARGTQIYVAPTWDRGDQWLASMRHIAKEGGCYVISCCMALHIDDIPEQFGFKSMYPEETNWINTGDSCIVSPSGKIIAGPVSEKEEILYTEVDIRRIRSVKRMLDVAGHYARPDIFKFSVNSHPNPMLEEK